MRLGFIGTGVITEAIVTGLCQDQPSDQQIRVSPRNPQKSAKLSQAYTQVSVADSNQSVVDQSDLVFLAFLPGMEDEILTGLPFRENQTVVTVLAGTPIDKISALVQPATTIVRAVPLPCTALCTGPVVMYPDDPAVNNLFNRVGSVIVPDREDQLEIFSLITALMAPFYALTDTVATWGVAQGLKPVQSAAYTAAMFKALALIAENEPNGDIRSLVTGCMTPGGLNETAMRYLSDNGGFSNIPRALDAVAKAFSA